MNLIETIDQIKAKKNGLLPCPFCGGKAEIINNFGRIGVACSQCDANFRSESICSEADYDSIIAAWNTRTYLKLCEALKVAIKRLEWLVDIYPSESATKDLTRIASIMGAE